MSKKATTICDIPRGRIKDDLPTIVELASRWR
jgi:hypothetical protein